MKVYSIVGDYSKDATNMLENNDIDVTINYSDREFNTEEIVELLQEYDALIIGFRTKISKDILNYVKTPKVIATLSIGLDHIDKEVLDSDILKVINVRKSIAHSVAEHIFSLIFSLNRRIYEANTLVLEGNGDRKLIHERVDDIYGKTLGLIGAGNITKEVIKIANVFCMKIVCYSKHSENHKDLLEYGVTFKSLDDVLSESDIINVSVPLNDETKNMIFKEKIDLMKNSATFINTSRVEVVDIKYLIEKADKFSSFYVGLDIDCDNYKELLSVYRNNVIVTSHIAGVSKQSINKMDLEIADSIIEISNMM